MGGIFSREKNEDKLYKKVAVGNKYFLKFITFGLLTVGTALLTFFSFGTILLIDGGITLSYLIITLSFSIYEKLINKYLKNIPPTKKRDFKIKIHKFYENIINPSINEIYNLIDDFIYKENILEKTNEKFEQNKNRFIDDSKLLKNKYNILLIGPSGSGKSTLINEFLNLSNNKATEGIGDVQTLDFKEYKTDNSKYCLIDSQGFDYSKPIGEFSTILQSKIQKCNESPYSFIDMIYYCTNNMNRFQTQEYQMINELKKIFNLERIPLIIVFTQCYFEEDYIHMKNFIQEKYGNERYSFLRVVAKPKGNVESYGLEELKIETEQKLSNFTENAYACKFIANISQKLYKDYTRSFFSSFIKGFLRQDKNKSIKTLFTKIFNMYRFEERILSDYYIEKIEEIKTNLIDAYEKNLVNLTDIIIDLHAESCIIEEFKLKNVIELPEERKLQKEDLVRNLKNNEFKSFKQDIDKIVFPCCLDVLKIEIIKTFNEPIFNSLKPKIEELMAQN